MPYKQGIFIDIFPLDGVPNNHFLRAVKNFQCFCVRKILWSEVGKIAEKDYWKRICFKWMSMIPEDKIWRYYHRMVSQANRKDTKMVRILMFPTPNHEYGYYRKWYEKSEEILFEGKTFWGIGDYDSYLSFKFGNYMELPPVSMRKVHPVSSLKVLKEI